MIINYEVNDFKLWQNQICITVLQSLILQSIVIIVFLSSTFSISEKLNSVRNYLLIIY